METATRFKIATTDDEFDQISGLSYRAFVEEIPQYAPNATARHVDAFHAENTYVIGVRGDRVIAQLAIRRHRPFSLDRKLPDLDRWLPPGRNVVELRLLAVDAAHRNGPVVANLLQFVARYCRERGDEMAVISGAVRRQRLYRALGFEAFGPLVGTAAAPYQPMRLTLERFTTAANARRGLQSDDRSIPVDASAGAPTNLLPGPVTVSAAVLAALGRPPLSHRAPEFMDTFAALRRRLAALVHIADVQILPGSGSLANDLVAAQLAGLKQPGFVISSGEFGERLADHAARAGLEFHGEQLPWGEPITRAVLQRAAAAVTAPAWMWLVHHETSTGVLHDLDLLKAFSRERGLRLCLDCISSVGAVAVNLEGVHLASAVSGKGLASLPGLALVFHAATPVPRGDLPRYLDLGYWARCGGVPFTHSSNLVAALDVAVAEVERLPAGRCETNDDLAWLRTELRAVGFELAAAEAHASPVIATLKLPDIVRASVLGAALERRGFLTSHRSAYLADRNWLQFCLMTSPGRAVLQRLVEVVSEEAARLGMPLRPELAAAE